MKADPDKYGSKKTKKRIETLEAVIKRALEHIKSIEKRGGRYPGYTLEQFEDYMKK